jgi:hypothetical protein
MSSAAVLALVLGLAADAPTSPMVALEAPPPRSKWTENWAVSIATGRSFYDSGPNNAPSGSIWDASHRQSEIRVTHQGAPLVLGAALHRVAYPLGPALYAIGAGLVVGARHPLLSWLHVELDATLGAQVPRHQVAPASPFGSQNGTSSASAAQSFEESGSLELYARLGAGLALRVASWLDIPVSLTLHMRKVGESHSLGAASVGLRCLLP